VLLASTDAELDEDCELQAGREAFYKGVPVIVFPKQLGKSFKYSRPFSGWLNENVANFDLVHIHAVFNHACIAAAQACQKQGVPYFVRPLGTLDPWSMKQKSLRKKLFWHSGIKGLLTKATAIHYTAKAEQEAVESSLNLSHGFVVPLGVELKPINEFQEQRKLSEYFPELDGHPYVLVLSRLHPKKALDVLIDAFLSVVHLQEFSEWRLVIAGDGEPSYVDSLKQMVPKQEGEQSVIFTGWLANEEKSVALENASLLALPSRQENFGLCVAEAMAYGVAVIVSPQVNLAAEIEESQSGWVAPLDSEKLAEVLAEAMQDNEERAARGRAGAELARSRFTWPAVAAELSRLYMASVAKRSSQVRLSA
jgi:glycosyltransferase involved in cell wall biosynthesis